MLVKIKNFLKLFCPVPVRAFNREIERILTILSKQTQTYQRNQLALARELTQQKQDIETSFALQQQKMECSFQHQLEVLRTQNDMLLSVQREHTVHQQKLLSLAQDISVYREEQSAHQQVLLTEIQQLAQIYAQQSAYQQNMSLDIQKITEQLQQHVAAGLASAETIEQHNMDTVTSLNALTLDSFAKELQKAEERMLKRNNAATTRIVKEVLNSSTSSLRKDRDSIISVVEEKLVAASCANIAQVERYYRDALSERRDRSTLGSQTADLGPVPDVTVVIPVYNTAQYLDECLQSVVAQTLQTIEIICIDDGSTDHSWEILKNYASNDNRIRLVQQRNSGLSTSRNVGIQMARGRYTYFIDSDDWILPEALENLVKISDEQHLDVLFFDGMAFYETEELERTHPEHKTTYSYERSHAWDDIYSGQELAAQFSSEKAYRVTVWLQFTRTDHLIKNRIWFPDGAVFEDNAFTFRSLLAAQRTSHRNISYYRYRIREGSITTREKTATHLRGCLTCYVHMAATMALADINPLYESTLNEKVSEMRERVLMYCRHFKIKKVPIVHEMFRQQDWDVLMKLVAEDAAARAQVAESNQ